MKQEIRDVVCRTANKVRKWAEITNQRRKRPSSSGLEGWCAIASAKLHRELAAQGIKTEIFLSQEDIGCHVFLVIDDYIVDVTATQFREYRDSKVLIIHRKEAEVNWFHCASDVFDSADELRANQIRTGWPENQTAHAA